MMLAQFKKYHTTINRTSFSSVNPFLVMWTCLYMAVKTEESGPIALKKYMSFLDEGVWHTHVRASLSQRRTDEGAAEGV